MGDATDQINCSTTAGTVIPTLPELPTSVVATLPPCPAWCDRQHSGWGVPPGDSIIHAKTVGDEIKVRGDSILELAVVAVTVEMHDYIDAWRSSAPRRSYGSAKPSGSLTPARRSCWPGCWRPPPPS